MKTILRSDELSCPSCIAKIEKALLAKAGVSAAKVQFANGRIDVEHDPAAISPEELRETVRGVGYEARVSAF